MIMGRVSKLSLILSSLLALHGCVNSNERSTDASSGPAEELVNNGSFIKNTDGWWASGGQLVLEDNMGCLTFTDSGENPWDVIFAQSGIPLAQDQSYTLNFSAFAKKPINVKVLVQQDGQPYTNYLVQDVELNETRKDFNFKFIPKSADEKAQFQLQLGALTPTTVCISNVSLKGPRLKKVTDFASIRVNQVGYAPHAMKRATMVSESEVPLTWSLLNNQGTQVAEGKTKPFGLNRASNEKVHIIDFSEFTEEKNGLTLLVDGKKSHPFNISSQLYEPMKYDALSFFYQQRSGIPIEEKYVQRADLARPAGHPNETVTCFNKTDAKGNKWPGCDYKLNVTGGWYDAGDHGKYVVNGGISAWTLMNFHEHEKYARNNKASAFFDGKVKIPENSNKQNDLLDEARWMMDFMLAMQVPDGKKAWVPVGDQSANLESLKLTEIDATGLVFHKVADEAWTGMPLPPHKDPQPRYLSHPSTAATLNLAATSAQCARIWKDTDSAYSKKCLTAAEKAWKSAKKHPDIYAYDNFVGSGPYDDTKLDDEFYWAAAELFVTTGKAEYLEAVKSSPYYLQTPKGDINATGDLFWQDLSSAGTITLALVPNKLRSEDVAKARKNIINTANAYTASIENEGYLIPYTAAEYPWGSNSNLMNRSIFLGLAHDFTGDRQYVQAMSDAMDYILGRNPLDQSYVSGYGFRQLKNPHHRFWAHQIDPSSPLVPPGVLSGGPNSMSFSDPIAAGLKGQCTGQTCWKDEIGAWTLNEVTTNWNAPFFWTVSYLDEGYLNK
ncbi:glycoside hydrolase family 9 protein [Klebsiella sp. BIGb0407]|uniref:glycoside hydrolase family 9 protein n=1 Tax=Klebsiella sp. BIGb0407 TaxID=2940603 RepID=UPI0021673EA3|nr:glycoside hydrolase family 9 protein [Klebsiella sp. BIGb0407]MCS3434290.1 endoglucanase [Klebsiella sp. BIGb0407]